MATTYAAYYNMATANNTSRKPSSSSTSSAASSSSTSKTQKVMAFLAPRIPMHETLTPTAAIAKAPRRPLFQNARKGNEMIVTEKRLSTSASRKPSSIDRVYNVHLSGTEYFGMDEKK